MKKEIKKIVTKKEIKAKDKKQDNMMSYYIKKQKRICQGECLSFIVK